jgi:hypothetical protein
MSLRAGQLHGGVIACAQGGLRTRRTVCCREEFEISSESCGRHTWQIRACVWLFPSRSVCALGLLLSGTWVREACHVLVDRV